MAQAKNFQSKRERKQVRKGMVRAYVANKAADIKIASEDRAAFYRNLRMIKLQRRKVADHFARMVDVIAVAENTLRRVVERVDGIDYGLAGQVMTSLSHAHASAEGAAAEYRKFARRRVYYTGAPS